MSEKEKFKHAKDLMDSDRYAESLSIFLKFNLENKDSKFIELTNLFVANCYFNLENYDEALNFAHKSQEINKKNEFTSQLIYLSFVKLDLCSKAFDEILKFLKSYPAGIYKVTLRELINDIYKGNIHEEFYITKIKDLAIKNKVFQD